MPKMLIIFGEKFVKIEETGLRGLKFLKLNTYLRSFFLVKKIVLQNFSDERSRKQTPSLFNIKSVTAVVDI